MSQTAVNPARDAAVDALMRLDTTRWLPVDVKTFGLDDRDAQLARAIYRTAVQRKITIDHVLAALVPKLSQACRCVLEAAAAQLLFFDRLPAYAVINTAVEQARRRDKPAAARMVNAVCRNLQRGIAERQSTGGWPGEPGTVPWGDGFVRLGGKCRIKTLDRIGSLSFATSAPVPLVRAWCAAFGEGEAERLLRHTVRESPTMVRGPGVEALPPNLAEPHEQPGFAVWRAGHAELVEFLDAGRDRWVQDPTASLPAEATADLRPMLIADYCAGRGTKTRQLAVRHPGARIVAADMAPVRQAELQASLMRYGNVQVVPFDRFDRFAGQCDLLLLDVPCSNTGVLARRLEARYRYSRSMLDRMVGVQRRIVEESAALLADAATLVYATCSLEACENAEQARWIARRLGMTVRHEQLTRPGGRGRSWRDGGYFAVLRRGGGDSAPRDSTSPARLSDKSQDGP